MICRAWQLAARSAPDSLITDGGRSDGVEEAWIFFVIMIGSTLGLALILMITSRAQRAQDESGKAKAAAHGVMLLGSLSGNNGLDGWTRLSRFTRGSERGGQAG